MPKALKIKDSEHLFTDYSTVSSFNDYENGVLDGEHDMLIDILDYFGKEHNFKKYNH